MSDATLKRIEKTLDTICEQQQQICERLVHLEERVANPGAATRKEAMDFLDKFGAGEAFGEELFGAWIAVSDTECLRGGLRTIQMREGMHAHLLHARLKELGGTPTFEYDDSVRETAMKTLGGTDTTDAVKLSTFMGGFADADTVLKELTDLSARLTNDLETQSLLQTIEQDERSTLAWLKGACEQLNA